MRRWGGAVMALALLAESAWADEAPDDGIVLMPRSVIEQAITWISAPDARNAVQIWAAMAACLNNNPHEGTSIHMGRDQCKAVTDAIAARDAAGGQAQVAPQKGK